MESNTRYGYTAYDLINSVIGAADPDVVQTNTTEYNELLTAIRGRISEDHANTLNGVLTDPNAHNVLMPIILSYVTDYVNQTNDLAININRTAERIYQDMAGFGILTPYLNDPTVEEININAWNSIEVFWSDHSLLLEETFASPQECVDIIRKMVRIGGVHVDYSQPIIDSFIGDGTRISTTLPPINQDLIGATASIRKQTYKDVTRESYLSMGFATPKLFDFIRECILRAISFGFAGSPGAGKTTFMTYLLKDFLARKTTGNNRVITIEEAREIELSIYEDYNPSGGHPRMISRNIQWNTKSGEHPVNARQLIRHTLRYDPQIIVPAEMRGEEAIEAVESGLTGVQIISSFHAWGAKDGYIRVLSMCQMGKSTSSEATLLQSIIRAFPLMVFIKKDDDGVRRIHEVFEATGVEEGKVVGNTLFRFIRTKVEEDENGRVLKIHGDFVQIDSISKNLRHLLIQNGARREFVDQYYFEDPMDNPDHPEQYEDAQVEVVTIQTMDKTTEPAHAKHDNEPKQAAVEPLSLTQASESTYESEPTQKTVGNPHIESESALHNTQVGLASDAATGEGLSLKKPEESAQTQYGVPESSQPATEEPNHLRTQAGDVHEQPNVVDNDRQPDVTEAPMEPNPPQENEGILVGSAEPIDTEAIGAPQWSVARRIDDPPQRRSGFWGGIKKNREGGGRP